MPPRRLNLAIPTRFSPNRCIRIPKCSSSPCQPSAMTRFGRAWSDDHPACGENSKAVGLQSGARWRLDCAIPKSQILSNITRGTSLLATMPRKTYKERRHGENCPENRQLEESLYAGWDNPAHADKR